MVWAVNFDTEMMPMPDNMKGVTDFHGHFHDTGSDSKG